MSHRARGKRSTTAIQVGGHCGTTVDECGCLPGVEGIHASGHQGCGNSCQHVSRPGSGQPRRRFGLAPYLPCRSDNDRGRAYDQYGDVECLGQLAAVMQWPSLDLCPFHRLAEPSDHPREFAGMWCQQEFVCTRWALTAQASLHTCSEGPRVDDAGLARSQRRVDCFVLFRIVFYSGTQQPRLYLTDTWNGFGDGREHLRGDSGGADESCDACRAGFDCSEDCEDRGTRISVGASNNPEDSAGVLV
nr:hypothetical protein [Nocardia carnea]